ncbi:hypothetical protein [Diaphorobacter aerolatus]|uniref:Uncharacterized protein n=1 Tax=Diaphorobacter aerolatus TaxID=1288495 RepID=A0A7H0GQW5_9BURK|nr:hypothetical protein [Diaphorobacter aerolatus]QNP50681.1 hypothetical protein H9K75_16300 [Diaphorobacter aerolatus]
MLPWLFDLLFGGFAILRVGLDRLARIHGRRGVRIVLVLALHIGEDARHEFGGFGGGGLGRRDEVCGITQKPRLGRFGFRSRCIGEVFGHRRINGRRSTGLDIGFSRQLRGR